MVGAGPDLVLIPGQASSRETWKATADRLRGRYRLHLVQVAGFAGEPARANAAGDVVVPTAEAIDSYIAGLNSGPVLLSGHSLGGSMALYLAQKHPEHLSKVLIVDAYAFTGLMTGALTVEQVRPVVEMLRNAPQAPGADDPNIRAMARAVADQDRIIAWGRRSDPGVAHRAILENLMLDQRPGLPATRTPITVMFPDNAGMGGPPGLSRTFHSNAYRGLVPLSLVEIKESRHFIMFDQPDEFAKAFDAWLAG